MSLNKDRLMVIDFYASWCAPCRKMHPHLKSLAADYPQVAFFNVNVDMAPEIAELHDISTVPTFIFIRDKRVIDEYSGSNVEEVANRLALFSRSDYKLHVPRFAVSDELIPGISAAIKKEAEDKHVEETKQEEQVKENIQATTEDKKQENKEEKNSNPARKDEEEEEREIIILVVDDRQGTSKVIRAIAIPAHAAKSLSIPTTNATLSSVSAAKPTPSRGSPASTPTGQGTNHRSATPTGQGTSHRSVTPTILKAVSKSLTDKNGGQTTTAAKRASRDKRQTKDSQRSSDALKSDAQPDGKAGKHAAKAVTKNRPGNVRKWLNIKAYCKKVQGNRNSSKDE